MPSHGVGGEFEHCRLKPRLGFNRTPMLGLYLERRNISPYLLGISDEEKSYIWFRSYFSNSDLALILDEFLSAFG